LFEFKTVKGGELGIKETWSDGVVNEVLQPKNYYLFPGFSQEIVTYDARLLVYELTPYVIKSADNQEMTIKSKVQWRRDPTKLVHHHKTFKQTADTIAINPAMIGAILRHGTQFKALDAYSGEGLIKMQSDIQADLLANKQLKDDGIVIESFIIEYNHLNPEYLEMINSRQLATLRQSKAIEEQKAAEAEALVAKSKAQADLNKQVVEAQRDKEVMVLKAQAEKERQILAATGQSEQSRIEAEGIKAKLIAEAEGKKQAMIATAEGTLAMGKAEATSRELMLQAFNVKGADGWVKVEVSKNLSTAFGGIKGYIPQGMNLTVLSDSYLKAVDVMSGAALTPTK
jgi:regulator of protease activity HflC (stomatin/prohibitin superfamily)